MSMQREEVAHHHPVRGDPPTTRSIWRPPASRRRTACVRMVMELDGEVIERIDPHVRPAPPAATEKLIEHKNLSSGAALFRPARLLCTPLCMEHSYVLAIEKAAEHRSADPRPISAR